MATKSSAWQRRNDRARALGYRNYYDYRVHGFGTFPATAPAPRGAALRRLRGHASAADLISFAGPGTLITAAGVERNRDGSYRRVDVVAINADGDERTYVLQGKQLQGKQLDRLVDGLTAAGAAMSPSPSLDISTYGSDDVELDWADIEDAA